MQEPRTWRELLGKAIKDPQEKQRLADELGINAVTLARWASGLSNPRPQNLHQLVKALPQHRKAMTALIAEEFLDIFTASEEGDDALQEIPSAFYTRVLSANTITPRVLRASSIFTLILQQVLAHLDPNKQGMSITAVLCSPPGPGGKVRSLRETLGRGTHPWKTHLENQALLLGAESLAGYAVTTFRLFANQNVKAEQTIFPVLRTEYEESAVACPLLHGDRVAGCMLVASNQGNYFTPPRQAIIQNYADLMVLACEPQEFYDQQSIELALMPPSPVQQRYFADFPQRVTNVMIQTAREGQALTWMQAEQLVWQQIEEEFLHLAVNIDE